MSNSGDYQYALLLQQQIAMEEQKQSNSDLQYALLVQKDFEVENILDQSNNGLYYKGKSQNKNKDRSKSLIDPSWELVDPTPNIHELFVAFNQEFFWNKLVTVTLDWSKKMMRCAGVCSYRGIGTCKITLSEPLLKLRPRKDLVETLLHEMIHAYLFVTHNNKDRDGHGPEFHKHMYRINNETGANITVYHDFHDEVKMYQQHWWKCNGPCQHRQPYYGMVRRAMNRAPGPSDRWFAEHSRSCGGTFIKVKEPEKPAKKGKENSIPKVSLPDIRKFFTPQKSVGNLVPILKNDPKNPAVAEPNVEKRRVSFGKNSLKTYIPSSSRHAFIPSGTEIAPGKPSVDLFTGTGKLLTSNKPSTSSDYNKIRNPNNNAKKPTVAQPKNPSSVSSTSSNRHGSTSTANKSSHTSTQVVYPKNNAKKPTVSQPNNGKTCSSTKTSSQSAGASCGSNNVRGFTSNGTDIAPAKPNVELFTGTGNLLTTNTPSSSGDYYQVRNHWLSKYGQNTPAPKQKRRSRSTSDIPEKYSKKPKMDEKVAPCPVCDKQINVLIMHKHIDECLIKNTADFEECFNCKEKFKKSEIAHHLGNCLKDDFADDLEFDEDKYNTGFVVCDICGEKMKNEDYDNHKSTCLMNLSQSIRSDELVTKICTVCETDVNESIFDAHLASCIMALIDDGEKQLNSAFRVTCEICNETIKKDEMGQHMKECNVDLTHLSDSYTEEDIIVTDEVQEQDSLKEVSCPICSKQVAFDDINRHIDECLQ